ncbi:MAG TPA: outer membrane beta-barrel protein, partial [Silvibacterium sp.]|nr:outer membrane beta-barrel protein [Silvibacterium sp.]
MRSDLGLILIPFLLVSSSGQAQTAGTEDIRELRETVKALANRVAALEAELEKDRGGAVGSNHDGPEAAAALASAASRLKSQPGESARVADAVQQTPTPLSPKPIVPTELPGGATLNFLLDGYYEYNFNDPIGRVNYLRAYDVLSNAFSINQAGLIFELAPDPGAGRRYGMRLDLQYGQATDSLQGNPANERRPQIYQNIYQAYGSYIFPVARGLQVDFGKWSSSIGIESNYTKDQMNYTRSYWYDFLPFYHQGVRTTLHINDKLTANYWLVNGTQQSEPTNSYKDELFGFNLVPNKSVNWTVNYYVGQDHPDTVEVASCGPAPVQPGLCFAPIIPAPNGKLHIFDSYANWNATPKVTLAAEADYEIEREWANAAPGQASAPLHAAGGAAYAQYQWSPRLALAARGEYMADPQGLFSNVRQALKEGTVTMKYQAADGLDAFLEYRYDWSNQKYFLTHTPGVLTNAQPTVTLGLVWWYGGKQGAW